MMRRRFAWVLNLDAEFELEKPSFNATQRLIEQLAVHGAGSRALLGPEDVLISEGVPRPAEFIGRAWCPTPRALAAMRNARVEPEPHPNVGVLRRVNHRRFAVELGGGLPEQAYVESRAELERLLRRAGRPWLLKRALAFAGRGQMRIYGNIDAKQSAWIDASLRGAGLVIEPLVEPSLELSLHGFIWRDGTYELGRCCVQDVSARGVFRGIRLAEPEELPPGERETLSNQAAHVAEALAREGYFGPYGIDAYRCMLDNTPYFCALSEINARYSMGFVTGFPRHPSELSLD
ncbi:MAG: ATP-grasp domain-containing protein [Myxococcota bacterium]